MVWAFQAEEVRKKLPWGRKNMNKRLTFLPLLLRLVHGDEAGLHADAPQAGLAPGQAVHALLAVVLPEAVDALAALEGGQRARVEEWVLLRWGRRRSKRGGGLLRLLHNNHRLWELNRVQRLPLEAGQEGGERVGDICKGKKQSHGLLRARFVGHGRPVIGKRLSAGERGTGSGGGRLPKSAHLTEAGRTCRRSPENG